MSIITFDNVSKRFSRKSGHRLLRQHIASLFARDGNSNDYFYALKNISFTLAQGESLAVVGHNGAGKSTLLGLVAGLTDPDAGVVRVGGRMAAMLDLGSGFHGDLTGRENIWMNSAILGLSKKEVEDRIESIVEFAEIHDFIDEPLRTYSNGMMMRLAFSIAVSVDPDILLIDEILAVGDAAFQSKCVAKIHDLRESGKSLICVSHAQGMIQNLCDRALWLAHGSKVLEGEISSVLKAYEAVSVPADISPQ